MVYTLPSHFYLLPSYYQKKAGPEFVGIYLFRKAYILWQPILDTLYQWSLQEISFSAHPSANPNTKGTKCFCNCTRYDFTLDRPKTDKHTKVA
jgi:hypothetical protein